MEKLKVKVIATISNQWVTTEYKWLYRNRFIANQQIESYKRLYGERFKVISITNINPKKQMKQLDLFNNQN